MQVAPRVPLSWRDALRPGRGALQPGRADQHYFGNVACCYASRKHKTSAEYSRQSTPSTKQMAGLSEGQNWLGIRPAKGNQHMKVPWGIHPHPVPGSGCVPPCMSLCVFPSAWFCLAQPSWFPRTPDRSCLQFSWLEGQPSWLGPPRDTPISCVTNRAGLAVLASRQIGMS